MFRPALLAVVAALMAASSSALLAKKKESPLPTLPGYVAVPIYYSSWNKMLMNAVVNGKKTRFIIDTGAGVSVLDAFRARALGVRPVGADSPYGEFTNLNGEEYRIGYIDSLRAGAMDFGNGPIALFVPSSAENIMTSRRQSQNADGVIGADILTRYKAVINCVTKTIFFKVDPAAHLRLAAFAVSQHFVRVPLREEVSRVFTVPGSVNDHACRLLLDTGSLITTFDQRKAQQYGLALKGTRMGVGFSDGVARQVSLAQFDKLKIGDFHVPPQKLSVVSMPEFAVHHGGEVQIAGIVGMELLAFSRGIIDFGSMSLFLK